MQQEHKTPNRLANHPEFCCCGNRHHHIDLHLGNDSKCIQFSNMIELADDVPYGYGLFHMVFASGATYIGMLFVGWNAHRTMEKWTVDVSWASTRVRATSGLVVAVCYTLMLVSQELWNLMLAVTSNSTPSSNEASPVGDGVVHPVAQ